MSGCGGDAGAGGLLRTGGRHPATLECPAVPRDGSSGDGLRARTLAIAILASITLCLLMPPSGAHASVDISGTWNCCGAGGAAAQNFQISDSGGSLSGRGLIPGGSSFAVITGSVSGSSVTIVTTYEASFDAGYVATFVGTISGGATMSGTWSSNAGQSGTWTATLEGGAPPTSGKLSPSFTAVSCTISVIAPDTSTCTAQVAAYAGTRLTSPTGTVSFSATSGTIGSSCTLAPTAGSPGISSCTVSYLPPPNLAAGVVPDVRASYSGDSQTASSSGQTSSVPRSVVLFEDEDLSELAATSDGGSSEGIPIALTNTNPFAVSADEELTVKGYPAVANTSSASVAARRARTEVIGRASHSLAPLQTLSTTVKLTSGGARLLRRHKRLNAVLVIVTKEPGKPGRTARYKLLVKILSGRARPGVARRGAERSANIPRDGPRATCRGLASGAMAPARRERPWSPRGAPAAAAALLCVALMALLAPGVAAAKAPEEAGCPMFPANNPLNEEVANLPMSPNSANYIAAIGANEHLHADFGKNRHWGIPYRIVGPEQRKVAIDFNEFPEESDPGPYPIPLNAPVEGAGEEGDQHVLVLQKGSCMLYELYHAQRDAAGWEAGSGAVFNLRSNALRPEGWTSADAAGLPIMPLLVRYPEVQRGQIDHALRVTVRETQRGYIHPATHFASSSSNPDLPPMGLRLRLSASFDLAPYHGEALVILEALKRFGLIVADNGSPWFITGAPSTRWNEEDLNELKSVPGSAFEAVETGPILHG